MCKKVYDLNSSAVQTHLQMYQAIIARMASNSGSVKTWCVTLVAALLVLISDAKLEASIYIVFVPIILFFALDVYYLVMEKRFRAAYNEFVKRLHQKDEAVSNDLFKIKPDKEVSQLILKSITSIAIWPFYGLVSLLVIVLVCK